MNSIENQLRDELGSVAASAPSTDRLRSWFAEHQNQPHSGRNRLAPVFGAAAATVAILGTVALLANQQSDPLTAERAPSATTTLTVVRDTATERKIDEYIQSVLVRHPGQVEAAVDWEKATILLTVTTPIPSDLDALRGDEIAGLAVSVVNAEVSQQDYEALIRAVASANFADKDRIQSFSHSTDASSIQANITDLADMPAPEVEALKASIQNLTSSPVTLTQAIAFRNDSKSDVR